MIFLFHLLTLITGSLGLALSFSLNKRRKIKSYIMLFFLFLSIGICIHVFYDAAVSRESFIKYYINLEHWPPELTINYLLNDMVSVRQNPIP